MNRQRPTREQIAAFCGVLKRQPGAPPLAEVLAADRAEELGLEDAKWTRFRDVAGRGKRVR